MKKQIIGTAFLTSFILVLGMGMSISVMADNHVPTLSENEIEALQKLARIEPPDFEPIEGCERVQGGLLITVKNNGAFAAAASTGVVVKFSWSNTLRGGNTGLIAANGTSKAFVEWPPEPVPAGDFDVWVIANPSLQDEINTANNFFSDHCIS